MLVFGVSFSTLCYIGSWLVPITEHHSLMKF
jgi:hypothetical protein